MNDGQPEHPDVAITEDVWGSPLEDLARRRPTIRCPDAWRDIEQMSDVLKHVRALVVRNRTRVDKTLMACCPNLRIVARAGVGLDNIDVAAANEAGIVVVAPAGANARSVAEHAIGLALALCRRTVSLDAECRRGNWSRLAGRELQGATWGMLGAGATARACGELATAFGMRVIAYDPYADPAEPSLAAAGIGLVALDEVTACADVISCHLPATPETTRFVGRAFIEAMRPGSLFINVGRGEAVDEDALADALASGKLGGAALDVRAQEPPVAGRIEGLGNVVLTPHIAGITAQSQLRITQILASDIDAVLSGGTAVASVGACRKARQ